MDDSEVLETQNTEVEQEENTTEELETVEDEPQEDVEKLKSEKSELERKNKQLYERLKKQESRPQQTSTDSLSAKDFLALKDANISADDFDEVQEFATFKKISIADAIKNPTLRSILNERQEERRTAHATATKSPRGATKASGDDLLRKAERTNELPDNDDGMRAIFEARRARQFNLGDRK